MNSAIDSQTAWRMLALTILSRLMLARISAISLLSSLTFSHSAAISGLDDESCDSFQMNPGKSLALYIAVRDFIKWSALKRESESEPETN